MRRNSNPQGTPAERADHVAELADWGHMDADQGGSSMVGRSIAKANRVAEGHPVSGPWRDTDSDATSD